MYERSAIVLERYFSNILGYFSENNLKVNFQNYCSLVEKLDAFQSCYEQEQNAIQEFDEVTDRLKVIQKNQEKAYKKTAKLEYNRNILFNNIEDSVEDLKRCLLKIENDIDKNNEYLKRLREDFVITLDEYNESKDFLSKSKKAKKESEKSFVKILEQAQENVDNINEFILEFARNFNGREIREKLLKLMIDNGKEEKIPFDEDVLGLAADLGIDIAQKEISCYVEAYDSILLLFDEIDEQEVKIEKFKRKVRNIKVMLNFILAQKEYLFQFLDYERMTSVNGKRIHKKLMIQACENFKLDIKQINNLYELILKEIANKSSQKIYKELYNKSYLLEIDRADESLRKERNKVNSAVATVLGSNYWRIEGIKNIYTVFYKDVSEVFGRYLDEFDVPIDEELELELNEEVETLKASLKAPEKVKVIKEEIEEELPLLISEEDFEIEAFIEPVVAEKVEEVRKENLDIIEKTSNEIEILEEERPKRRRKDIIKEEEEKKKEQVKLKEKNKDKKEKVEIVEVIETEEKEQEDFDIQERPKRRKDIIKEEEETKKENIKSIEEIKQDIETEEVPKRRKRKDIIKEEEEIKKGKIKVKEESNRKKENIKIIEEIEELDDIEEKEYISDEQEEINENIYEIEKDEDLIEEDFELEEEEESLFGNIKTVRSTRRNTFDLEMLEQLEEKNKSSKKGLFGSIMNMNSKKGKRVAD